MATPPTRRFVLATTATAAVAFLLIVPSVLHLVDPAFGQATGGVYDKHTPPGQGSGRVNSSSEVKNTTAGQSTKFTIPDTSSKLLDTSSALDAAGGLTLVQNTDALTGTVKTPENLVKLVGSTAALNAVLANTDAATSFTNAIVANPSSFSTIAQVPGAAQQILSDPHMQAALAADANLRNQVSSSLQSVQHVSAVDLTTTSGGAGVQVSVKEFLPTDAAQNALSSPSGSSLASITLQVSSGSETTSYHPLKILEISTPGVEKGGVATATIHFSVTQAELTASNLQAGQVQLLHQVNGAWVPLPTTLVSGPTNGVYELSAVTPGFSYFAIAAAQPAQSTSGSFAGLGIALLILAVLAVIAIAVVVVMKKKQA